MEKERLQNDKSDPVNLGSGMKTSMITPGALPERAV